MVGAIPANLHEGCRSEYLAQYVFASFGTAVPVPHHEDSGIDLYCTLTERLGSRAWPRAYFSIQVKSTIDPWILDSEESVRWFVEHPFPLFLCIVDKCEARLRVYHTSPRFFVWSLPPLPKRLELTPTLEQEGRCTQWQGGTTFCLSAPILDASVQDLFDAAFHAQAREVLRFWIDLELKNLARVTTGIHSFTMPDGYTTNTTTYRAWVTHRISRAPDLSRAMDHVKDSVAYLSSQLHCHGDLAGAARCAMLLRHFFKNDLTGSPHDPSLHMDINGLIKRSRKDNDYLFRGIDSLNAIIDHQLGGIGAAEG